MTEIQHYICNQQKSIAKFVYQYGQNPR